jgi:hypothetical protein
MIRDFSKMFVDITKYVITAVIISAFFKKFEDSRGFYFVALFAILLSALIAVVLYRIDKKIKK